MNDSMKPLSIPGYEVLEMIGQGGMSAVWKARQLSLDRLVAIKVLTQQSIPDAEARKLFQTEARAAARLSHPGIIQVFDANEVDGMPYYVMEYVPGESVGDILARQARLQEFEALRVAGEVGRALMYAWDKARIIHCDIKPDNLLVSREGTVKIADMGLARFFSHQTQDHGPESHILGTPNYISPEQARGEPDLDCRADIYSLGATLYHMVTGVLPFAGSPGSSAMDKHIEDYLPDPTDYNPAISGPTAWLIEKMLVKDRMVRHQTWNQFLRDLQDVQSGHAPAALPAGGASTVRRSERRGVVLRPPTKPGAPGAGNAPPAAAKKVILVTKEDAAAAAQVATDVRRRQAQMRAIMGAVGGTLALGVVAAAAYYYFVIRKGDLRKDLEPLIAPATTQETTEVVSAPPETPPLTPPPREVTPPEAPPPETPPPTPRPGRPARPVEVVKSPFGPASTPTTDVAESPTGAAATAAIPDWRNAEFLTATRHYNTAVDLYANYQKTRTNPEVLRTIDSHLRRAITLFEQCRGMDPNDVDIPGYIQQCNKMIFDVRQSTTLRPGT